MNFVDVDVIGVGDVNVVGDAVVFERRRRDRVPGAIAGGDDHVNDFSNTSPSPTTLGVNEGRR